MKKKFKTFHKGFTLIELLVVIAVLGVLAAVVMVAINPGEQLARGRDSGRKSAVGQLINALQSYYTAKNATYPASSVTWITDLATAGELKAAPAKVTGGSGYTGCGQPPLTINQNDYCYYLTGTDVVVYTKLESTVEKNKCPSPSTQTPYFLWDSIDGRAGVYCGASEPSGVATGTYVTP